MPSRRSPSLVPHRPPGSKSKREPSESTVPAGGSAGAGSWSQVDPQLAGSASHPSYHRPSASYSSTANGAPAYPFSGAPHHSPALDQPQTLPRPSLPSMHSLSSSLLHHHHGVAPNATDMDAFLHVNNHYSPGDAYSLHLSRSAARPSEPPMPGSAVSQPASLLFDGNQGSMVGSPYGQTPSISAKHLLDFAGGAAGGAGAGGSRGNGGTIQRLGSAGPDRSPNRTDSSAGWISGSHARRQSHGSGGGGPPNERFYFAIRPPEIQVEDVISWNTVSFFTSLFIRHTHALCQVVHVPTFTRALVARRDKHDRQFRAFLLGLSKYFGC